MAKQDTFVTMATLERALASFRRDLLKDFQEIFGTPAAPSIEESVSKWVCSSATSSVSAPDAASVRHFDVDLSSPPAEMETDVDSDSSDFSVSTFTGRKRSKRSPPPPPPEGIAISNRFNLLEDDAESASLQKKAKTDSPSPRSTSPATASKPLPRPEVSKPSKKGRKTSSKPAQSPTRVSYRDVASGATSVPAAAPRKPATAASAAPDTIAEVQKDATPSSSQVQVIPAAKPKLPPPVILRDTTKWSEVSAQMRATAINFSKARNVADGIRIQTSTSGDFRKLTKMLDESRFPYHTFTLAEERSLRVVIRGLPVGLPARQIFEDLAQQGLSPMKVSRMHIRGKPIPLVLVELPTEHQSRIYKTGTICDLVVQVEKPRKSSEASQCHRCQRFHHSQRNCTAQHRCVKCGAAHETATCTKQREQPAKCANCSGAHTANYKGCPHFPKPRKGKRKSASVSGTATATKTTATKAAATTKTPAAPKRTAPKRAAPAAAAPTTSPAPSARKQADLDLQRTQLLTAIASAKDAKSLGQKLVAFIPLLLR